MSRWDMDRHAEIMGLCDKLIESLMDEARGEAPVDFPEDPVHLAVVFALELKWHAATLRATEEYLAQIAWLTGKHVAAVADEA